MAKTVSSTEAREKWADILNRVGYANQRILIQRHEQDIAAIVPAGDLQILEDRMNREAAERALEVLEQEGDIDPDVRRSHVAKQLSSQILDTVDVDTEEGRTILRDVISRIQDHAEEKGILSEGAI